MIAAEFKTPTATIRIHDEYFETAADNRICRLGRIVSEAYKRRQLQDDTASALNAVVRENKA